MDASSVAAPPSGGGSSGALSISSAAAHHHQQQQPLLIARTPLNVYLKIAIIRNPTDEVVFNDPERPGMKKRVVVSDLLDGSLTKITKTDDDDERKNNNETSDENHAAAASSVSNNDEEEGEEEKGHEQNKEAASKKEIPVPTITTVDTYDLDVPPTYHIPASYVRYIRPTFHETHYDTVEYNVDVEDEMWWRSNKEFGPNALCKILIDGKEQPIIDEEEEKVAANNNSHLDDNNNNNTMDIDHDNNDNNKQTASSSSTAATTSRNINKNNNNYHTPKTYTIQQVLLTNPKYYLHSKHTTQHLLKKYHPKLPLRTLERIIDILEKETGFDFVISLSHAEKVLVERIPELEDIFGWIDGSGDVSDDDDENDNNKLLPTLAPPPTLKHVISTIYNYWITKRNKLKKPLLRRYHPVTSSNDTNPHMVFRPREKEKRKLRKKRQNDIEAYKKMVLLQRDFEKLRGLCELILKREEVSEMMVELSNGYFEERLSGWLDTTNSSSGRTTLDKSRIESVLNNIPRYYDDGPIVKMMKVVGKKRKRSGLYADAATSGSFQPESRGPSPVPPLGGVGSSSALLEKRVGLVPPHPPPTSIVPPKKVVVAGHDDGLPAPNFLQPLPTRESHYSTNWEGAVPILPSYENGMLTMSNNRFRHRPRLGRGGRIIIDRVPCASSSHYPPPNFITYGAAMNRSGYDVATLGADAPTFVMRSSPSRKTTVSAAAARGTDSFTTEGTGTDAKTAPKKLPAQRLENLLPKLFLGKNRKVLSRKIEEICVRGLMEECSSVAAASTSGQAQPKGSAAPNAEEFVDEVLVPIEDWVEAPNGEIYGIERYVLGPI